MVVERCPAIDTVICVNDGSTDRSRAVLREFGDRIVLVDLQPNQGKGRALAEGIRRADGDIVAFFDADLTNLSEDHVDALIGPVASGRARAVLGSPGGDFMFSVAVRLAAGAADSVGATFTGQRAYRQADLMPHLARMDRTRFGVEVFLNSLPPRDDTLVVTLWGLTARGKRDKHGWRLAVKEYSVEVLEVSRELARTSLARLAGS